MAGSLTQERKSLSWRCKHSGKDGYSETRAVPTHDTNPVAMARRLGWWRSFRVDCRWVQYVGIGGRLHIVQSESVKSEDGLALYRLEVRPCPSAGLFALDGVASSRTRPSYRLVARSRVKTPLSSQPETRHGDSVWTEAATDRIFLLWGMC